MCWFGETLQFRNVSGGGVLIRFRVYGDVSNGNSKVVSLAELVLSLEEDLVGGKLNLNNSILNAMEKKKTKYHRE